MAGKHLVLHFDGKLLKHLDENTLQSVVRDRVAVSVTSPEFENKNDLLLGVLPAESGKAVDETEIIHNLLESFEICNEIFAIVADTTNVNTGAHGGIITRLCYILGKPVLWLLCRHHMFEIAIHKAIVIVLGPTAAPDRQFYKDFKKDWEVYHAIIQKANLSEFKKFDEKKLEVGSELHKLYLEAQEYLKFALNHEVFPRDDYNHLVKYAAFYLNVSSPKLNGFKIYQPGANHNARFMADSLYNLAIVMTSGIIDFLPKDQLPHLEKSAFICAVFYAPWYLRSYKAEYAVKNDFLSFKSAYVIQQEFDVKIGNAFLKFFQQHSWYLAPKVAVLILADPDFEEKLAVLDKLLTFEVPDINTIPNGKPDAVLVLPTSEVTELITEESWALFIVLGIQDEIPTWKTGLAAGKLEENDSYISFCEFVKSLNVTNDPAERNINLIQRYISSTLKEDKKQDILLVVREHRALISLEADQSALAKL